MIRLLKASVEDSVVFRGTCHDHESNSKMISLSFLCYCVTWENFMSLLINFEWWLPITVRCGTILHMSFRFQLTNRVIRSLDIEVLFSFVQVCYQNSCSPKSNSKKLWISTYISYVSVRVSQPLLLQPLDLGLWLLDHMYFCWSLLNLSGKSPVGALTRVILGRKLRAMPVHNYFVLPGKGTEGRKTFAC